MLKLSPLTAAACVLFSAGAVLADESLTDAFASCMADRWMEERVSIQNADEAENEPAALDCAQQVGLESWSKIDWPQYHNTFTCETITSFCPAPQG